MLQFLTLCMMFLGDAKSSSIVMTVVALIFSFFLVFEVNYSLAEPNFGAAGDWGCSSNTKSTVTNIRSHNSPERVFAIGDYSYTSTPTCWLDIIDPIKSRTRIAIGNHEGNSHGY